MPPPSNSDDNVKKAIDALLVEANTGDAKAQNHLGDIYRDEMEDVAEALLWYHRAADQGYDVAQINLGYIYYVGLGVPQNYAAAMEWYGKAAAQGSSSGQFNLGTAYLEGKAVQQDYDQAMYWLRKAADQNNESAQFNIGSMYEHGLGVTRDDEQAMAWYHRSLDNGDDTAADRIRSLRKKIATEAGFTLGPNGGISRAAMARIHSFYSEVFQAHGSGDWGDISIELELQNMRAVKLKKGPVLSRYVLGSGEVVEAQSPPELDYTFVSMKDEEPGIEWPG